MSLYIKQSETGGTLDRQEQIELYGQINFHKTAVAEVKARVGKDCTFLSHLTSKEQILFLAHLVIDGKKTVVRINTGKAVASELTAENYKALNTQLKDYVSGRANI